MTLNIHVLLAKVNELFNYLTFVNEIHYYGFYFTMTQSQNVTVYAKVHLEAFGLLCLSFISLTPSQNDTNKFTKVTSIS